MNSIEQGPLSNKRSHEQRREALLKKLELKVNIQKNLFEAFLAVQNRTPEEIEAYFNTEFNKICSLFPEKLIADFNSFQQTEAIIAAIPEPARDVSDQELENHINRIQELMADHDAERRNPDINFLMNIKTWMKDMVTKRATVIRAEAAYRQSPEQFEEDILRPINYDHRGISDGKFDFTGCHINIIVDQNTLDAIVPGMSGLHLSRTPLNLINTNDPKGETRKHEENHNLFESFTPSPRYHKQLLERLEQSLGRLDLYRTMNIQAFTEKERSNLGGSISHYSYELVSEMKADLDNMAEGNFSGFLGHFRHSYRALSAFARQHPRHRELLEQSVTALEDHVVELLTRLEILLASAKRTGKVKELQSAFILLGPREIDKIESLVERQDPTLPALRFFYPALYPHSFFGLSNLDGFAERTSTDIEISRTAELFDRCVPNPARTWSPSGIKKFTELVKTNPEATQLSPKDKATVQKYLRNLNGADFTDQLPELQQIKHLIAYDQACRELGKLLDIPEIEHLVTSKSLYHLTVDACTKAVIDDDYAALKALLDANHFPREEIAEIFHEYATQFATDDFHAKGETQTEETLASTTFGLWVKKMGFKL